MKKDHDILFVCMFCAIVLAYIVGRHSSALSGADAPKDTTSVTSYALDRNTGTVVSDTIPEKSVWVYNVPDNIVYEHRVQDFPGWSEVYMSDGTVITNTNSHFVNTGEKTLSAEVSTELTKEMKLIDGEHALQYFNWVFKTSKKTYKHRDSLIINVSLPNPKYISVGYKY